MAEVDPHHEETSGTIKQRFQRALIIIFILITVAFFVGLYKAIVKEDEKEEIKQTKEEVPVTTDEKVVGEVIPEIQDFEDEVEIAKRKAERERVAAEKRQRLEDAKRRNQVKKEGLKPLSQEETVAGSNMENFKRKAAEQLRPRNMEELIEVSSYEIRQGKADEDFLLEERKRALKARMLEFSEDVKPKNRDSNQPTQSRNEQVTARKAAAIERQNTQERLAEISQRVEEAQRISSRLQSDDFNPENLDQLVSELRDIQDDPPIPHRSRFKAPDGENRIVGATLDKAQDMNLVGTKLPTGTAIKAVLSHVVMSDYASGSWKGQITNDVYDADYETIIFPKGTVVDGQTMTISNVNEPIQARMGMTVRYFVLPNGNRIDMRKSAQALDAQGIAALKDEVDYHLLAQFLGVAAYAVITSETASDTSSAFTGETNIGGDIGQNFREQLQPLASRYLNLKSTITLNAGMPMTIYIEEEIMVEPWGTIYDELL